METRKLGIALLAAVVVFVVLQFGITSDAVNRESANWKVDCQNMSMPYQQQNDCAYQQLGVSNQMFELKQSSTLYAIIGAVVIAGVALVIVPSSKS